MFKHRRRDTRAPEVVGLVGLAFCLSLLAGCGTTVSLGAASEQAPVTGQQDSNLGLAGPQTSLAGGPAGSTGQSVIPGSGALAPTVSRVTGGSGAAGTSSVPTSPPVPLPTGGASHAPILVGVLLTDTSTYPNPAGDASQTSPGEYKADIHAYLAEINKHGGIAGRQLKALDASIKFTAPDYTTEAQAACTKLTQDHHVDVVVYDGIVYNDTLNTCLARAGIPSFVMGGSGGSSTGDAQDFRTYLGLATPNTPSMDRRITSVMNKAISDGYLTPKNKLGVMVEDCPYDMRTADKIALPIAARHHITTYREDLQCETGFANEGTNSSLLSGAVLRFRSEGVDTVIFITLYENGLIYFFAKEADSQNWAPQYLTFVPQAPPAYMALFSQAQLEHMRGFGGEPFNNVTHEPAPSQRQAAVRAWCLAALKAHGLSAPDHTLQYLVWESCDAVRLMQASLDAADGQTGVPNIMRGLESLGNSFVSTLTIDGVTHFGPARHDGLELTQVSIYFASCKCFKYVGRASPI